ncbi:hypothetical protein IscW_ISCW013565 [Ixodes scapularis]|uniref:Uncharacterized protein n=1 Tax=Ixodes scapularis TaxID=6945 RepID=B7QJH5_IXOSC|nr:hypothetical protein IscW_ISCW013565 [Ixodes scapularis]|eukprot:XP_002415332.1 hypothetical protein IscW_ISCW013565 [Ixodes scapularis]
MSGTGGGPPESPLLRLKAYRAAQHSPKWGDEDLLRVHGDACLQGKNGEVEGKTFRSHARQFDFVETPLFSTTGEKKKTNLQKTNVDKVRNAFAKAVIWIHVHPLKSTSNTKKKKKRLCSAGDALERGTGAQVASNSL